MRDVESLPKSLPMNPSFGYYYANETTDCGHGEETRHNRRRPQKTKRAKRITLRTHRTGR